MSFPARLFTVVATTLVFVGIFSSSAFAQTAPNPYLAPNTEANVPQDAHTLMQSIFLNAISFIDCQLTGYDIGTATHECLGFNNTTGKIGYAPNDHGLLGVMTGALSMVYTPPDVHVATFTQYLAGNFGLVKNTYAAGTSNNLSGYQQLSPMIGIWTTFRNVVFLLFVIVFIVIGFAIMLRAKIDPRTVMTIENQIPKIIIALILVTFSYAIAGLVIDLMWVMIYVSINLFATMDPALASHVQKTVSSLSGTPLQFLDNVAPGGILGILVTGGSAITTIFTPVVKSVINVMPFNIIAWIGGTLPCLVMSLGNLFSGVGGFLSTISNGGVGGPSFGQCVVNATADGVATISGGIAVIIMGFALFFAIFRIWFALIKSYVLFLLYALLGPFFIMMGVLPGSKVNFENWIRHLIAYSFVFPFAIGIMLLGKVITDTYSATGNTLGFVPPLIGVQQASGSALGAMLGFGVILLLPQALTMIQDALSAPDMKYIAGVGQMLAAGTQAYTTIVSKPWERATRHRDSVRGLSEGWLRTFVMDKLPIPYVGKRIRKWAGENEGGKSH